MTDRVCVDCGTPETRRKDARGRVVLNLNPLTGQCLTCMLAHGAKPKPFPEPKVFDPKLAQAGKDE